MAARTSTIPTASVLCQCATPEMLQQWDAFSRRERRGYRPFAPDLPLGAMRITGDPTGRRVCGAGGIGWNAPVFALWPLKLPPPLFLVMMWSS
jgi:hypothetical protein